MTEFTELVFPELDRSGFKKQRAAFASARVGHAAQTELLKKFFEQPFEIVNIELCFAFFAAPEQGIALPSQSDGQMPFFPNTG